MHYTVDYFIAKFEAIPEEQWCMLNLENTCGQKCALGHLGNASPSALNAESVALVEILRPFHKGTLCQDSDIVTHINDFDFGYWAALGETPKQRILAALRMAKQKQA